MLRFVLVGQFGSVQQPFIAAMSLFKLTLFSLALLSAEGLRKPAGVAGDPVPPPYPVVNVHVPEPSMSAADLKSAAVARQREQDALLSLEVRIKSMEKQTSETMAALALQVKDVGDMIEMRMAA